VNLTSYRGVTFTSLGVTSAKFVNTASPGSTRQVAAIARTGADPIITGVETGTRALAMHFTVATGQHVESTLAKVLAACNPDDPIPGTLVGTLEKAASTPVTVEAQATAIGPWSYPDVNTIQIQFVLQSPWREQSNTTLRAASLVSADGSFTNLNTGYREVLPTVTVYWDGTQRGTSGATFGWKHRIGTGETITNTGTEPFINQPYQIGPIGHAAIVAATQGLASGNDLRVFCQGKELRRNIIAPNTAYCFLWVVLPTVAPGQSITLEILTNNPSAGTPPTLTPTSDPLLPAMDIGGEAFTATSSVANAITKSTANWETNQWQGGVIIAPDGQMQIIVSNSATSIVVGGWDPVPSGTGVYVITRSGLRGTRATASSGTASSVTSGSLGAGDNEWIGATVHIYAGTGIGQTRTVTANTNTVLTITPNWTTNPDATSKFRVYRLNGNRVWDLRTTAKSTPHAGLWLTNRSATAPSIISFDAPASWYRFTFLRSEDEYSQPRIVPIDNAGNIDYFPIPYMQRAAKGRRGTQNEAGIADSIGVSTPFPILSAFFGYNIRNAKKAGSGTPGEGLCEARFMTQESGGNAWSTFLSDVAVYSSNTTVTYNAYDLTGYGSPNRLAWTLIPNGSDTIPQSDTSIGFLTGSSVVPNIRLSVNPTSVMTSSVDWVAATPATVAVYDVSLVIRNGGASATKPYDQIVIGGIDHRVFIAATDERIVVDCEKHLVTLTTDAGVYIRRIPYCVQAQELVTDAVGTSQTLTNTRWLPIPSSTIDAANIYYTDPGGALGASWGSVGLLVTGRLGYLT
jgi:hypothetical protein